MSNIMEKQSRKNGEFYALLVSAHSWPGHLAGSAEKVQAAA